MSEGMTYQTFVSLYGDLLYLEFIRERVYDIREVNYDQYLRMKYKDFLRDFPQHKPKEK